MQKIIFLLFIGIIFSCNSQSKKDIDIKGNWYTFSIKGTKIIYYVETFIDDKAFHYYDQNFGLKSSMEYVIEDGILYYRRYMNNDREKTKESTGNVEIIDDNTISIHNGTIILKRIVDGIQLEDILRKNVPEKNYQKYFYQRKAQWEKQPH